MICDSVEGFAMARAYNESATPIRSWTRRVSVARSSSPDFDDRQPSPVGSKCQADDTAAIQIWRAAR